ncbi:FCD domain-containing protein [Rhizobium sp. NZLR1]|uniref:FCD domain-containing protein n=1 Tax=Rhizobium sp. NZLR1 TaxID=2731096 RepID=UPI001A996743|nr:FCD domain-containing protein [Rhizobium sp. NZLR1]MBX5204068.1 FCD domain-containing protein [Rhizobium sp. NZLR1]QSZ25135.1 FCD domain-containing protein [Rhizobium sp. NZLR1]
MAARPTTKPSPAFVIETEDDNPTPSLTSVATAAIRKDILLARLKPGKRLGVVALKAQYNCGGASIREALSRLISEGLVVATDHKGFRVSHVSRSDLIDLTITRGEIDGLALSKSIENGDVAWEGRIVSAFHQLSKLQPHAMNIIDAEKLHWDEVHNSFHFALVSACGSPRLLSLRNTLLDHAERYRNLSGLIAGVNKRDTMKEHKDLMDAALARNAEAASRLIAEHYWRTCQLLLEAIDSPGSKERSFFGQ